MNTSREDLSKLQSINEQNSVRQRRLSDRPSNTIPQRRKGEISRKTMGKFIKAGMAVSLTSLVLSGFKVVRPIVPLHPLLGVALVVFTVLHLIHYKK